MQFLFFHPQPQWPSSDKYEIKRQDGRSKDNVIAEKPWMGLSAALPVNKWPHCDDRDVPALSLWLWRIYHLWIIHYSSIVGYQSAHPWCHLLVFVCSTASQCGGCMYLAMCEHGSLLIAWPWEPCCSTFIFSSVVLFVCRRRQRLITSVQ